MNIHCISTAQKDLGLRSRTLSLTINKLPTFSKMAIIKDWVSRSDECTYGISTSHYVLILRYRPHHSKYKDLHSYKPQNYSIVTT